MKDVESIKQKVQEFLDKNEILNYILESSVEKVDLSTNDIERIEITMKQGKIFGICIIIFGKLICI